MLLELDFRVLVMWALGTEVRSSARISELLTPEPLLQPKLAHFEVYSILPHGLPEEA